MPGSIIQMLVEEGQRVEQGAPLMILGAMKMEHTLTAPYAGKVESIRTGWVIRCRRG
jgi:3-methylcrotonyl-CoA carboxylase alpha subunit